MIGRSASRAMLRRRPLSADAEIPVVRRHRADIVIVVVLTGALALGLSAYGLINNRFNRIDTAIATMARIDAPSMYSGRPTAAAPGPGNFAVFATSGDGSLAAALIFHLAASHDDLTVIAVPANTRLPNGSTLREAFAHGVTAATKGLEQTVGARMDHQFLLRLDQCDGVVTAVGGLRVGPDAMDADRAMAYVDEAATPAIRADRLSRIVVATMSTFSVTKSLLDPSQFDKTMDALQPCVSVDVTLTGDEIRSVVSGLRIHTDAIGSVVWPDSQTDVVTPAEIKTALALDDLSTLPLEYHSEGKR